MIIALLSLTTGLVLQSRVPPSRVLQLRGGSVAAAPAKAPVASREELLPPPGPLRLNLVEGSDAAVVTLPRVELSSANVETLQLKPGDRIRLHREAPRRSGFRNPFQRPVPDATLGEVGEDAKLGDGEVRMPAKAMTAMRLDVGDGVFIVPVGGPSSSASAGQAPVRRHHRSFANEMFRYHLYRSMFAPRYYSYGGYHSGGLGARRRASHGFYRRRSYGSRAFAGRRSYGGRRR